MPLGAAKINFIAKKFSVTATVEVLRRKSSAIAYETTVSTAQSKFGGGSYYQDGTGGTGGATSRLQIYSNGTGTGDYTVEFWIRFAALPSTGSGGYMMALTSGGSYIMFKDTGVEIAVPSGVNATFGYSTITTNTWYHFAFVRRSGDYKTYWNGSEISITSNYNWASKSTTAEFVDTSAYHIGRFIDYRGVVNGWIDEFRISKSARYTANFTPSTTAFVNDDDTIVLLHMDGTNGSSYFEDDNGLRIQKGITAVGNAQIDTAQSKFGGASALFDGSGDYLQIANSNDFNFGASNFTIEGWVRAANFTSSPSIIGMATVGSNDGWNLQFGGDGRLYIEYGFDGGNPSTRANTTAISTNTWTHFAFVRNGSTVTAYKDGVAGTTHTISLSSINSSTANLIIGDGFGISTTWIAAQDFNGHLDEIRISNIARYTSNFTAPTAPFVNDANTLLLIHGDGNDGSTVFRDDNGWNARTAKHISYNSSAQISTTQSKFGGSSLLIARSAPNDWVKTNETSDLAFDAGAWTIEFWFRASTLDSNMYFPFSTSDDKYNVTVTSSYIQINTGSGGSIPKWNTSLSTNTWYHFAAVKESGSTTVTLYIDGTSRATGTNGTGAAPATRSIYVGDRFDTGYCFDGYIDEVRVSNTARYTSGFTPSTTEFANDSNTLLLLHFNGLNASTVFVDDVGGRASNGVQALGNAQLDTAQSKFGGSSSLYDGTGDYLQIAGNNNWNLGTNITQWTIEGWLRKADVGTYRGVISNQTSGASGIGWGVYISNTNKLTFAGAVSDFRFAATSISANTWYHFAIVRNGSSLKMFLNGVEDYSVSNYTNKTDSANTIPLFVGRSYNADSGWNGFLEWNGHLDEIRISNVARYTAAFTAPTAPFQNDANTLLLLHMDGTDASTTFIDDNGQIPKTV